MQTRLIASAAATAAVAFVLAATLLAGGTAQAVEPDVLPDALWWRSERNASLDTHPLQALSTVKSVALDVEWAPLYAGPDGAQVERERRTLLFATQHRRWRAGAALDMQGSWARGGGHWWLDAERPITTSGAVGTHLSTERFEGAASLSTLAGVFGLAAGLRAQLAPRAYATFSLSRVPRVGRAFFQLDDIDVAAEGRWIERRQSWEVAFESRAGVELRVGQQTLDRARDQRVVAAGDRLELAISWRASSAQVDIPLGDIRVSGAAHFGEGREMMRVDRNGLSYAAGEGPVTNLLVSASAEHARAPYRTKLWYGRWRGDADAVVALWPFNGLGAAAGTRQIAQSNGALRHMGVSVDRVLPGHSGLEGGLALWRIEPHASFQSWRSTLFGIGRSDASSGAADVRSVVATGLRLAAIKRWRVARLRVEAVQWLPVWVERNSGTTASSGAPGVGGQPDSGGARGERGGTVVRFSLEVGG